MQGKLSLLTLLCPALLKIKVPDRVFRSSAIEEHFFFYEKFESFHGTIMPIKKSCFLEYDIGYTKEKF